VLVEILEAGSFDDEAVDAGHLAPLCELAPPGTNVTILIFFAKNTRQKWMIWFSRKTPFFT
jgi:hypothetical protein